MKYIYWNKVKGSWGKPFDNSYVPLLIPTHLVLFQIIKVTAPKRKERKITVRKAKQQPRGKITPADYEFCPHCSGSFSFVKLGKTFICPWCHNDVRTSVRLS